MRTCPQLFLVGALSVLASCASSYPNPWAELEVDRSPAAQPEPLPELPEPIAFTDDTVTLDKAGAQRILEYKTVAEANTQIAAANADQVDSLKAASDNLVQAGKAQRALTDMAQQTLAEERRRHFFEKVIYWAAIIGLGAAL